jgi:hypothetical protein
MIALRLCADPTSKSASSSRTLWRNGTYKITSKKCAFICYWGRKEKEKEKRKKKAKNEE